MVAGFVFLTAALASLAAGFGVIRLLQRWRVLDTPSTRSSHSLPTIRGGGIGIMIVILGGVSIVTLGQFHAPSWQLLVVAALAGLLAVVSFIDDVRTLSPLVRIGCHTNAALLALLILRLPNLMREMGPGRDLSLPLWFGFAIFFLWLVGYTNAFNFMDGINGLAASQAVVTGLGMAVVASAASGRWSSEPVLFCLGVAGAAAGFLPHNFPRARMFMGDVSSAPLGFLLAILALWLATVQGWELLVPLMLLHTNFVLDTAITLLRRIARREPWYEAHREHFYQRLVRAGKSHTFVTGLEMALQAVVLILMTLYLGVGSGLRIGLAASVLLIWLAFFAYCERVFRRSLANKA